MSPSATYTLQVNGSNVHVTLKRMKSIRLHVKPTGEVTLSAPLGTSKTCISEFVRSKADWIRAQQEKQVDQHECTATVLSHHVREFPDIPDPNGAAGTEQNKAQTAA